MAHAEEMTYGTSYSNTASSFTKLNTTSGFSQSAYEVPSYHWGSESNMSVVARGYSTTNDGKIKTKHAWSGDETCQSATVRHYFADAYYLFNSVGKRIRRKVGTRSTQLVQMVKHIGHGCLTQVGLELTTTMLTPGSKWTIHEKPSQMRHLPSVRR